MLLIMRATQILLRPNYRMITACVIVILCMNPLIENMVVPWRRPADTEPPALVTSTTPPKLCCQRTNEPIWLFVRRQGRCRELRGLDESLQLRRHLCLLSPLVPPCFSLTSRCHCTLSPVEPEVHTGMVWWRTVSCGGFGASTGGVPQEFPVSSPRRSCWRWSGTAPSGSFVSALVCLPPPLSSLTIRASDTWPSVSLLIGSVGHLAVRNRQKKTVTPLFNMKKATKQKSTRWSMCNKRGGWAGCWL